MTLAAVAERLAVELSFLFLRLRFVATGDRTPISRIRSERSTCTVVLTYTSKPVKKRDNFSVHHAKRNASVMICDDDSEVNAGVFFDNEDDVLSLLNKILMCKEKIH